MPGTVLDTWISFIFFFGNFWHKFIIIHIFTYPSPELLLIHSFAYLVSFILFCEIKHNHHPILQVIQ